MIAYIKSGMADTIIINGCWIYSLVYGEVWKAIKFSLEKQILHNYITLELRTKSNFTNVIRRLDTTTYLYFSGSLKVSSNYSKSIHFGEEKQKTLGAQ